MGQSSGFRPNGQKKFQASGQSSHQGTGFQPSQPSFKQQQPSFQTNGSLNPHSDNGDEPKAHLDKKKLLIALGLGAALFGGGYGTYYFFIDDGLPEEVAIEQQKVYPMMQLNDTIFGKVRQTKPFSEQDYQAYAQWVQTPYLNQEIAYINRDGHKKAFFDHILANVSFEPTKQKLTTRQGDTVERISDYADNQFVFHIPDYQAMTRLALNYDYAVLQEVYKQREIEPSDYSYINEMNRLFIDYVNAIAGSQPLPTKEVTVELPMAQKGEGYLVKDDQVLDTLLFGSDEFHQFQDTVQAIASGRINQFPNRADEDLAVERDKFNSKKEFYDQMKEIPEILPPLGKSQAEEKKEKAQSKKKTNDQETPLTADEANVVVLSYDDRFMADFGFNTARRYLFGYPKNGEFTVADQTDAEGKAKEYADNQAKRKAKLLQAEEEAQAAESEAVVGENGDSQKDKKKEDQSKANADLPGQAPIPIMLSEPLAPEQDGNYQWIGAYYLQNSYTDKEGNPQKVLPNRGDGTQNYPLSLGTPSIVRALGADNQWHDIRLTLTGIVTGKDAQNYVQSYDDRNIGFDLNADKQLIAIEFEVENLEDKPVTVVSGFQLTDDKGNVLPRNGSLYSLKNKWKIAPHQTDTMQDWFYIETPDKFYLTWGKNMDKRNYFWYETLALKDKNRDIKQLFTFNDDPNPGDVRLLLDDPTKSEEEQTASSDTQTTKDKKDEGKDKEGNHS